MSSQDHNWKANHAVARLRSHREFFERHGGPLLRVQDLDHTELSFMTHALACLGTDDRLLSKLCLKVLNDWGIMCPHPQGSRLYEGLYVSTDILPFRESPWYHCLTCECIVINR